MKDIVSIHNKAVRHAYKLQLCCAG